MTLVVVGTDTGIGKTIFSAGLTGVLGATYFKPVQAGLAEDTDSQVVSRLSGCQTLPETYRLGMPASPHLSAEAEGRAIDPARLTLPDHPRLIVEGAGGLMVPLNRDTLYLDVIAQWAQPVILCARTQLGTINHTLLSAQALRAKNCDILGVAFIGDAEPEVQETICKMGDLPPLGRLPRLPALSRETLLPAFAEHMDVAKMEAAL